MSIAIVAAAAISEFFTALVITLFVLVAEVLDYFVERLNIDHRLVELVPYVQFNYAQSFIASRLTTKPDYRLTPGLAYLGNYCELSVGAQVALNGAANGGDRLAVIGLIEIFCDDLCRVEMWRGGLGCAYLLPALWSAGASLAQQQAVVETAEVVDAVAVDNQRVRQRTQLEQTLQVRGAPRQA
jgi:hypothetical protein